MSTLSAPPVPPARLHGILTDRSLEAVAEVATRLETQGHDLTVAEAELVMVTFGPAARELIQWRRKSALVRDLLAEDNVLMFPGARG